MAGKKKMKPLRSNRAVAHSATSSRSFIMSRIRSKNTKAELVLRRALWKNNIRFRIHSDLVFGKPDIFIMKYRLAIFVDGNFWHGYNWEYKRTRIKSNIDFWVAKIERNMERDRKVNHILSDQGFTVMRFWDHQVLKELQKCVNQVLLYVESCKMGEIPDFN